MPGIESSRKAEFREAQNVHPQEVQEEAEESETYEGFDRPPAAWKTTKHHYSPIKES